MKLFCTSQIKALSCDHRVLLFFILCFSLVFANNLLRSMRVPEFLIQFSESKFFDTKIDCRRKLPEEILHIISIKDTKEHNSHICSTQENFNW